MFLCVGSLFIIYTSIHLNKFFTFPNKHSPNHFFSLENQFSRAWENSSTFDGERRRDDDWQMGLSLTGLPGRRRRRTY